MNRALMVCAITTVMCAGAQPAIAETPVGAFGSGAPMAAAKHQKAALQLPPRLKQRGTTVLLKKPTYTNAGQRVRVQVTMTTRHGKKTTRRDAKVVRNHGRVSLKLSGRTWVKATVRYRAPKAAGYAAFTKTRKYRSWAADQTAALPLTGANAAGVEWKDFFSGLLSAVAEDVTGSGAIGWAVGYLFTLGENPKPDPLEEVKKQLEEISRQLDEIKHQIDQLSVQNAFESCAALTGMGSDAVATIRTQAKTFRQYADPKDPVKSRKDWLEWADQVLNTSTGSLERLTFIRTHLLDQGGQKTGALSKCSEAIRKDWETNRPALAEDAYYAAVWTYLNYFYQIQLMGLNNVVEAYHVRASDEYMHPGGANRPLPPAKDIKKICLENSTGAGASPRQNCKFAREITSDVYYAMLDQAKAAGAAYAWNVDGRKSIAMRSGTSQLWVTDLNNYGSRSSCDGPVGSWNRACGPTVGRSEPLSVTSALGYAGWGIARAADWRTLLGPKTVSTTGSAMARAGFPKSMTSEIIVYTGELVGHDSSQMRWLQGENRSSWDPLRGDWMAYCMFDTELGRPGDGRNTWVYCQDDAAFWFLANSLQTESGCFSKYHYRKSDTARSGSNSAFYDADFVGVRDGCSSDYDPDYSTPEVIQAPGWMTRPPGNPASGTAQYRWPMQDISGRQCLAHLNWGTDTKALLPRNSGDAWTMCGDDFKAWLKTQLPDPPKA